MRTLRELDNAALAKAKTRAKELCGEDTNYFGITFNEIVAMQVNSHFGDKYREMHALLRDVEVYLQKITHTYPRTHAKLLKRIKEV
jgi:hypothetical protein